MPLSLAVVTTVAAFMANVISPLPPLAVLGYALSLGVVSAFISSTVFMGALHVVFSKKSPGEAHPPSFPGSFAADRPCPAKTTGGRDFETVLISGLAVYGAASLETDFDLADFVNEDMDIMGVRDELTVSR